MQDAYDGRVVITYKVFPLAESPNMLSQMFGDPVAAKAEILSHWESARRYARMQGDDVPIQVELMQSRPFPYPYSLPSLMAVKAAEFQGGMPAHERYYNRAQWAHLVECRNVADRETLIDLARDCELDLDRFLADFESDRARDAVLADRQAALEMGISGTPTVVFDDKWVLSGAVPASHYRQIVDDLLAGREPRRQRRG